MTEMEWLTSDKPRMLQDYLESIRRERRSLLDGVSMRKLRLLACACVRQVWDCLPDDRCRRAIEVSERFADGLATSAELDAAALEARGAREDTAQRMRSSESRWYLYHLANDAANAASCGFSGLTLSGYRHGPDSNGTKTYNDLVRDIFGNPFRPLVVDAAWISWNDGAVVRLAKEIYYERDFDDLTNLGALLDAAGCTDESILSHCWDRGFHVRGCWVIDLLLGKS